MLKFFKDWTLPIAMIIGCIAYPWLIKLYPITPYLIFVMLLLTFCKVSPRELKPRLWHLWIFFIQFIGAFGIYYLLADYNKILAQGVMICVLCPTATAAAVITSKLGGNAATVTTYTLIANIGTAIAVPIFFPLIEPHTTLGFFDAFLVILGKIFPLLICPFFLALILRRFLPKVQQTLLGWHELAFYLWAISLAIVTGKTLDSILNYKGDGVTEILIAIAALIVCCLQFFLGKQIGGIYQDRISGGQSLGQKNTILAIWMAHTYLNPLSAIGPGSYVLWQNIVNSWQLWKKRKLSEKQNKV